MDGGVKLGLMSKAWMEEWINGCVKIVVLMIGWIWMNGWAEIWMNENGRMIGWLW